jgi:phosphoglycolate phosphatase-like HAD superfamily hydrolase
MTEEESEESDTCRERADPDLDHVDAVLFDLDGVLTDTALLHESARVTGLHFHDARGSGASWTAGATLPELMHRLGHKTPTAALRYQHSTSARHREVADSLGVLLRSADRDPEGVSPSIAVLPTT